jgi:hypothetical protein
MALGAGSMLRHADRVSLRLLRGGAPTGLRYTIEPGGL